MHEFVQAKAPDPLCMAVGYPALHQRVVFCDALGPARSPSRTRPIIRLASIGLPVRVGAQRLAIAQSRSLAFTSLRIGPTAAAAFSRPSRAGLSRSSK